MEPNELLFGVNFVFFKIGFYFKLPAVLEPRYNFRVGGRWFHELTLLVGFGHNTKFIMLAPN